jgi:hypothetical protein
MEIRRKVFSRLQNENGEERLYSTNEFELSYSEEGEKMFSAVGEAIKASAEEIKGAAKGLFGKGIKRKVATTSKGKAVRYIDAKTGKLVSGIKGQNAKLNKLGLTKGETKLAAAGAVGATTVAGGAVAATKKSKKENK